MARRTAGFLSDLHAFRGVAILTIVAAHVWSSYYGGAGPGIDWDSLNKAHADMHQILWHDTTLYFTLISGLLFSRILASRGWPAFFRSKALHVLLPYALMSLVFTCFLFNVGVYGDRLSILYYGPVEFLGRYLRNLWRGTAVFTYWYIPVLACLFVVTPAVYWVSRRLVWMMWLVAILPLFVSRTNIQMSIGTLVYFLGAYAIGVYFGIDYEKKLARLKPLLPVFIIAAIVSTAVLYGLMNRGIDTVGTVSTRESAFYIQKISSAGFLLLMLNRWKQKIPVWLNAFADYAFTIYFIHISILAPILDILLVHMPAPAPAWKIFIAGLVIYVAGSMLALIASMALRKVLGRYSRMIIGS